MFRQILILCLATVIIAEVDSVDWQRRENWENEVKKWNEEHTPRKRLFKVGRQDIHTKADALAKCKKIGGSKTGLVTQEIMTKNLKQNGYTKCNGCGWIKNHTVEFDKIYRPICNETDFSAMIVQCEHSAKGSNTIKGYDAYCWGISPPEIPPDAVPINRGVDNTGYVFVVSYGNSSKIDKIWNAGKLCTTRGFALATSVQVELAYYNGMSTCACGWMSNYFGMPLREKMPCGNKTDGLVECATYALYHAYCFADARMEPRGLNTVKFSNLGPNTYPNGIEKGAVEIDGGYVYSTRSVKGKRGAKNLFDAHSTCREQGGQVATIAQLTSAVQKGFHAPCGWAFTSGDHVANELQVIGTGVVKKICPGQSTISNCHVQIGKGCDVFCFKQCPYRCPIAERWIIPSMSVNTSKGRVFHYEHNWKYKIPTKKRAQEHCAKQNAKLATLDNLEEARKNGLNKCRCGFVDDGTDAGTLAFPVYRKGCREYPGVYKCNNGKHPHTHDGDMWDAYCIINKDGLKENLKEYNRKHDEINDSDEPLKSEINLAGLDGFKRADGETRPKTKRKPINFELRDSKLIVTK